MKRLAFSMTAALLLSLMSVVPTALAAGPVTFDFEPEAYAPGTIDGQAGWGGSGTPVNPSIDQEVVENSGGPAGFQTQSFRMSNAYTTGSFGDQVFSPSLNGWAGETDAAGDGFVTGSGENHFVAEWEFASATGDDQPGLNVVVSPDRGDGARMSWIQMLDTGDAAGGLEVNFADYRHALGSFVTTNVANNLTRATVHTIKVEMWFVEGIANDVVQVSVDGLVKHTGTSWEDFFRDEQGPDTRPVDSLLFRVAGTNAPLTDGDGFLFDNLELTTNDANPPSQVGQPIYPCPTTSDPDATCVIFTSGTGTSATLSSDSGEFTDVGFDPLPTGEGCGDGGPRDLNGVLTFDHSGGTDPKTIVLALKAGTINPKGIGSMNVCWMSDTEFTRLGGTLSPLVGGYYTGYLPTCKKVPAGPCVLFKQANKQKEGFIGILAPEWDPKTYPK